MIIISGDRLLGLMYIVAVIALAYILIVGTTLFGSARWFDTGVILIQPSEIAKILMILVLADYFARSTADPHDIRWIINSLLLTLGVVIWILLQPNLSTSIVIMVIWLSMLWICGLPIRYILILAVDCHCHFRDCFSFSSGIPASPHY